MSSTELAATPAPELHRVFPVVGEASYAQTHHGYPGSDIMAPCGARYVAPAPGVILETNRADQHDPAVNAGAFRGGLSVSLLGDDGVRYYGSHFQSIEDANATPRMKATVTAIAREIRVRREVIRIEV